MAPLNAGPRAGTARALAPAARPAEAECLIPHDAPFRRMSSGLGHALSARAGFARSRAT